MGAGTLGQARVTRLKRPEPSSQKVLGTFSCFAAKRASVLLVIRGPKDHINIRISRSGSKAKYKWDTRNHVL